MDSTTTGSGEGRSVPSQAGEPGEIDRAAVDLGKVARRLSRAQELCELPAQGEAEAEGEGAADGPG